MTFEPVYCANDRCPKYRDTGRRQVVAEVQENTVTVVRGHCAKCRQYSVVQMRVLVAT